MKQIIGMIHLDELEGSKFKGVAQVTAKALKDLEVLQEGGVDSVLVENWKDCSSQPFVSEQSAQVMQQVVASVVKAATVPVGVNMLPNDYRAAFGIAKKCGASFVQLDVFVNHVKTDYSYSSAPPFEVKVDVEDVKRVRDEAPGVKLFASIHPKHYKLLDNKTIELSAREAVAAGAEVIVVTGEKTGSDPSIERVSAVKNAVSVPVFVGSGLTIDNARSLLAIADGAIVGTAFKTDDFETVVPEKVKALMDVIKRI